jgi:hypothetical protein
VNYAFRHEMKLPAHSRYSATRPAVLDWFKWYNAGRPYPEQVKPFNFLLTFFPRRQEDMATEDPAQDFDARLDEIRPVAPYETDSEKALKRIFDRNSETFGTVPRTWLRTVADVFRDYHRQPEYKFSRRRLELGRCLTPSTCLRRDHRGHRQGNRRMGGGRGANRGRGYRSDLSIVVL